MMISMVEKKLLLRGCPVMVVRAEAKTEVAYYGETKSDDEFGGTEVAIERAVILVGAEAKTEVPYYVW